MNRTTRTTLQHIRRSPFQAAAAIIVLTTAFFVSSIFSLVVAGSEQIIRYFESRPQVTAFFKDDASEETIGQLQNSIQGMNGVSSVRFISKDNALTLYREQNKDDPLLLEMVTADILPASLEVRASSPDVLTQVADLLGHHDIVEKVVFQKDIIDNLVSWTKTLRVGGLTLVGFFLISSMLMVTTIVSMKIANHRTEIEVMRLLGATRAHIVTPFIFEGIFYGLLGSFFGWGAAYIVLLYSTPLILKLLGAVQLLPVPIWFMGALLAGEALIGSLIGLFASVFASRRFLK